jgi:hypothetical protein
MSPPQDTWQGRSKKPDDPNPGLEKAIEDAWNKSQQDANPPATIRIQDILVSGTNPISEYSVIVGRHI